MPKECIIEPLSLIHNNRWEGSMSVFKSLSITTKHQHHHGGLRPNQLLPQQTQCTTHNIVCALTDREGAMNVLRLWL